MLIVAAPLGAPALADQVIPDDLIVQGSTCIGLDCTNGEVFSFDTIRFKENNLRIHFDDTSASAGFPANDWRIIINDSPSGGANFFRIQDATAERDPFTIFAGAPTNSLVVAASGHVGIGTGAPALQMHLSQGDTPDIRLEQTSGGGFAAQTWDIAGNETNFFIRDVTGGNRLPFRIRPGAPTSSIDIAASGNVGVGTARPAAKLHVEGAAFVNGNLGIGTAAPTANLHVASATDATLRLHSTAESGNNWQLESRQDGQLWFRLVGVGTTPIRIKPDAATNALVVSGSSIGIGVFSPTTNLHVVGGARITGLANCSNGIVTNAQGVLSCAPAASPAARAAAASSIGGTGTFSGVGVGVGSAALLTAASRQLETPDENASATVETTCSAASLVGRWSLMGSAVEVLGQGSMLWCDATLAATSGDEGDLTLAGTCRSHSTTSAAPRASELSGTVRIADRALCSVAGDMEIRQHGQTPVAVRLLEGRLETARPGAKHSRGVAIGRMTRGATTTLQTLTLQR